MGHQDIDGATDGRTVRELSQRLLDDLRALEAMLREGAIEADIQRIGAEQELFLVDASWAPAPVAQAVLDAVADPHFTPELGRFNLEINVDPLRFAGDALSRLEADLRDRLDTLRHAARALGADVVLFGILPTLRAADARLDNMMPRPRYAALNDAITHLRGRGYPLHIAGVDELLVQHDSVMPESCTTSFQVHLQVPGATFARYYNAAQAVAAGVLSAAGNSPLLFGKRLWSETRIALFQQASDTRVAFRAPQDRDARVTFGTRWLRESPLELFREDAARFRLLLAKRLTEDPFAQLARGEAPSLLALRVHTGTVYRWNRACYGITDGRPHLRIENRVLPAGPTVRDEVANAALWLGAITALAEGEADVAARLDFDDAKASFFAAARLGLDAQLAWLDGARLPARELVLEKLVPAARAGLASRGIDAADVDRYLGLIEARVASGRTGARWLLESYAAMRGRGTQGARLAALTAAAAELQRGEAPVHEWPLARLAQAGGWRATHARVEHWMTTDVITVTEDEAAELPARLMEWRGVRHVPVEGADGRVVGIVSHGALLRALDVLARGPSREPLAVRDVMDAAPLVVAPEASTAEVVRAMRERGADCALVVDEGRLVGIVTERDALGLLARALDEEADAGAR